MLIVNGTETDSPNENKRTARTNSEVIFSLFINFDIVSKVLSIINMFNIEEIWFKLYKKVAGNLVVIIYKVAGNLAVIVYNKNMYIIINKTPHSYKLWGLS